MYFLRHRLGLQRTFSASPNSDVVSYTRDFTLWPSFLSLSEQGVLLTAALQKLDFTDSTQTRRKRRKLCGSTPALSVDTNSLQDLFFPEEYYDFEKVLKMLP
jgi:alkylated DNA repair protein alkB homolog 7